MLLATFFAMALIAYMPTAACAVPGGAGRLSEAPSAPAETLHRGGLGGLDVCAWQFVYGERPVAEAKVGAATARRGADCLVIDAEASCKGRYAAADRHIGFFDPQTTSRSSRLAPASRPRSSSLPAKAHEIDPGPAP